jgi:hypothetical protein
MNESFVIKSNKKRSLYKLASRTLSTNSSLSTPKAENIPAITSYLIFVQI